MSDLLRSRRFMLKWLTCSGGAALFLAACGGGSQVNSVLPESDLSTQESTNLLVSNRIFPQGVWSGDPTTEGAVLSTRALPNGTDLVSVNVRLEVADNEGFEPIAQQYTLTAYATAGFDYRQRPGDYIARQVVTGLNPSQRYFFRFVASLGQTSPVGSFKTLPSQGEASLVNFIHMSCANQPPYPVASALADELQNLDPAFVIFNGDTVYADAFWQGGQPESNIEFYRNLYRQQRDASYTGPGFPDLFLRTSFISNWDDHEVINDYSGRSVLLPAAQPGIPLPSNISDLQALGYQAFLEYTPVRPTFEDDPGVDPLTRVFRQTRVGADLEIFTLDLRQYRDLPGGLAGQAPLFPILPPGVDPQALSAELGLTRTASLALFGLKRTELPLRQVPRRLLGSAQKQWLKSNLLASNATFKIIVSEFIFSESYAQPYDRWEGYWLERQEILNFIEDNGIRNVVILSGDQHAGQISLINPDSSNPIWEVDTGPVGRSTLAAGIKELGESLGILNADVVYYEIINQFTAPVEFGGIPGSTNNTLRFYEIDNPNYCTVEVNGSSLRIQLKNSSGGVLTDPLGRVGELIL
ncbi:MAG: alkaline phosphatase D family protein [Cyanobacteriota bacterium]|nr:alkaline phosphatase D family protein [Cyanobacteriota bacterium]